MTSRLSLAYTSSSFVCAVRVTITVDSFFVFGLPPPVLDYPAGQDDPYMAVTHQGAAFTLKAAATFCAGRLKHLARARR